MAQFLGMIFLTDEVTFKLNGMVNWHKCEYWSSKNLNVHVNRAVNLPSLVWCVV
jgi:hypothetical protein